MPDNLSILDGDGYLRVRQIVPSIFPIGVRTWWRWVAAGRASSGVKLGPKIRAWTKAEIRELRRVIDAGGNMDKAA